MTDPSLEAPDQPPLDPQRLDFLLGIPAEKDAVFQDYLTYVANQGLLPYKTIIQYGKKAGEPLYNHVLNGIFVLEQLRGLLHLPDNEARVLYTAFTIHDINKAVDEQRAYVHLATPPYIIREITRLHLDEFFPGYHDYLEDIRMLMNHHPGHLSTGIDLFDLRNAPRYALGQERIVQLALLMKAADELDLSQRLDEQAKKASFLHHLNSFSPTQYVFLTHQVTEQRGSFTNIIHNAVVTELQARFDLLPLLLYPDGVAYLCPRAQHATLSWDDTVLDAIAQRVADTLNTMTGQDFAAFIKPGNVGIKVDQKCLDLGISFAHILAVITTIIEKRPYAADKIEQLTLDAIRRTRERMRKTPPSPELQAAVEHLLEQKPIPQTPTGMRQGELLRSYYIFLSDHFAQTLPQPWHHIYQMLELPTERWAMYDCFDARMDRAYAIVADCPQVTAELEQRLLADGNTMLAARGSSDPRLPLLQAYLRRVLVFDQRPGAPAAFHDALANYVKQQHRQCIQCSLPLPTERWVSGDVRSDVKVNLFSNRLKGGPGEPKRFVCAICQMQYLVEKLNYRDIRGEQTVYLHFFPYSFLPAPLLQALRAEMQHIKRTDTLAGAVRLNDGIDVLATLREAKPVKLSFTTRTRDGKAQPYGLYLPTYSETTGGVLTFPINPPGDNDTQKFLFVLQHALLLQHHFGCKVLVSTSAIPPLEREAFGDVFFDLTPLSSRGLIRQQNYRAFLPNSDTRGELWQLWEQMGRLGHIRKQLVTAKDDPLATLVAALAQHPLHLFYVAEKLAEKRAGDQAAGAGWLLQALANDIRKLATSGGETDMSKLDTQLERLAAIAWQGSLRRPGSWKKNSLLTPLDEVFTKLQQMGQELNEATIRAAAAQNLYEHIGRIRQSAGLSAGRATEQACQEFVQVFFAEVYHDTYQGKLARLLNHEKVLRSAFHFYIRQQIPPRQQADDEPGVAHDELPDDGLHDNQAATA